jgi:peroxin-5
MSKPISTLFTAGNCDPNAMAASNPFLDLARQVVSPLDPQSQRILPPGLQQQDLSAQLQEMKIASDAFEESRLAQEHLQRQQR